MKHAKIKRRVIAYAICPECGDEHEVERCDYGEIHDCFCGESFTFDARTIYDYFVAHRFKEAR